MNLLGAAVAAYEEIASHRLRAALAVLSIVIGVATLTLIVALGDIGREATALVIERQTGRPATLEASIENLAADNFAHSVAPRLAGRLDRYGVGARSRVLVAPITLLVNTGKLPSAAFGVDPALDQIRRLRLVSGRWLVPGDGQRYAPVAVLNRTILSLIDLNAQTAIDSTLIADIGGRGAIRVVGVVEDGQREGRVYVPADALLADHRSVVLSAATVLIRVPPAAAGAVTQRLSEDLAQAGLGSLRIDRLDAAEDFAPIFTTLQIILSAIAAISLISGSIGILNIGLATINQRAREFAIRRSFGATRADIFVVVLAESLFTTLAAGLLGVLIAFAASLALPGLASSLIDPSEFPPFPVGSAVIGLAVAVLAGIAAGVLPALRAMRVSIIGTIRS